MRAWWEDLLINTGGAAVGGAIALGIAAHAGKAAGLFQPDQPFSSSRFIEVIGAIVGAVGLVAAIVSILVETSLL